MYYAVRSLFGTFWRGRCKVSSETGECKVFLNSFDWKREREKGSWKCSIRASQNPIQQFPRQTLSRGPIFKASSLAPLFNGFQQGHCRRNSPPLAQPSFDSSRQQTRPHTEISRSKVNKAHMTTTAQSMDSPKL